MNIIFIINNYFIVLLAAATTCTYNNFIPPVKTDLFEKKSSKMLHAMTIFFLEPPTIGLIRKSSLSLRIFFLNKEPLRSASILCNAYECTQLCQPISM